MKNLLIAFLLILNASGVSAQIGDRLKNQINQRKDTKINNAINKGLDRVEGKLDSAARKKSNQPGPTGDQQQEEEEDIQQKPAQTQDEVKPAAAVNPEMLSPEKTYAKFDFVPGEKVILEDNFINESPDEIPSYWIPTSGQVEVARVGGQLVMGFIEDGVVYPRHSDMSLNSTRTTLEFDYLFRRNNMTMLQAWEKGNIGNEYLVIQFANDDNYYDGPYQENTLGDFTKRLTIHHDGRVTFGSMNGQYNLGKTLNTSYGKLMEDLADKWVHVSVAITERSIKVYLNSQRIINSVITKGRAPTFQFSCSDCSSDENGFQLFIGNVRIAEGGSDPYKQMVAEGRFIARGITFDVGKATLKPESFGILNTIATMMKENPTTKFEVGGHTDSDGDDTSNLKLSQLRADAVRTQLISMGIEGTRLTAKGYGETKPLMPNDKEENKANNRRVEFVKN